MDSQEVRLQRPSGGLRCNPPLCHLVAEGWLACLGWLTSGGLHEALWRAPGARFVGYICPMHQKTIRQQPSGWVYLATEKGRTPTPDIHTPEQKYKQSKQIEVFSSHVVQPYQLISAAQCVDYPALQSQYTDAEYN